MIKKGYPPIPITYQDFVAQLNACMIKPFTDVRDLNMLYRNFKDFNYSKHLAWVQEHGYETVKEWAAWMFAEWTPEENNNCLNNSITPIL